MEAEKSALCAELELARAAAAEKSAALEALSATHARFDELARQVEVLHDAAAREQEQLRAEAAALQVLRSERGGEGRVDGIFCDFVVTLVPFPFSLSFFAFTRSPTHSTHLHSSPSLSFSPCTLILHNPPIYRHEPTHPHSSAPSPIHTHSPLILRTQAKLDRATAEAAAERAENERALADSLARVRLECAAQSDADVARLLDEGRRQRATALKKARDDWDREHEAAAARRDKEERDKIAAAVAEATAAALASAASAASAAAAAASTSAASAASVASAGTTAAAAVTASSTDSEPSSTNTEALLAQARIAWERERAKDTADLCARHEEALREAVERCEVRRGLHERAPEMPIKQESIVLGS
jgi:hypothetical protein